jgi:ABC-type nitrate/sulfonate/bicarbonate transport system permease component
VRRAVSFTVVLGTVAMVLELLVRTALVDPIYFPPPSSVLRTLGGMAVSAPFWETVGATVGAMLAGFCIAIAIAIPVGTVMGQSPRLRLLLEPIVDSLRPMPSAAVIPVAILLLGLGDTMKTGVVVFGSLWPPILSTMDGIRGVDPVLIDTGRLLGLRGGALLRRVVLPAAMPSVLTGVRISLGIALILTVTTEMIAGSRGLGYFILDSQRSFAFPEMFAGIVALGVMGYVLTVGFSHLERRILFWHSSVRQEIGDRVSMDLPSDTMSGVDATGTAAREKRAALNKLYSQGNLENQIATRFLNDARRVLWIGMDGPNFADRILTARGSSEGVPELTLVHWRPLALRQLSASLARERPEHAGRVQLDYWHPSGGELVATGSGAFDLIGITYALHDLSTEQVSSVLRNAASMLQPGGRVLVATHSKKSFPELLQVYRNAGKNCGLERVCQAEFTHFDSFTQEDAPEKLSRFFANVTSVEIDTTLRCGRDGLEPFLEYASIFPFPGLTDLTAQERDALWTAFRQEAAKLADYTISKPSIVFVCSSPTV